MTRRSCQTLGPALPPRHERTPVTRCAAGALAPNTSCRRRFAVGASVQDTGVVGAAFGGQRTVAPARTRVNAQHPSKLFSVSSETPNYKSASVLQPRKPGSLSHHQSRGSLRASIGRLAHSALVCFSIQVRSTVASPRAWPNPSIERTAKSTLRVLSSAAHVKR